VLLGLDDDAVEGGGGAATGKARARVLLLLQEAFPELEELGRGNM